LNEEPGVRNGDSDIALSPACRQSQGDGEIEILTTMPVGPLMVDRPSSRTLIAVLAGIGVLCLATGLVKLAASWKASSWPKTDGVILESRLEEQVDSETSGVVAHLRYEYSVDGTRHRSSRVSFAQRSVTNDDWSRELVARHPAGCTVTVRYDPARPSNAALFVGTPLASFAQPLVGLAFLAGAVMVSVRSRAAGRNVKV
jgi:hypothetical protein